MPMYACQLQSEYTQTTTKLLLVYHNTYQINHALTYTQMYALAHTKLTITSRL